jgi:hypothetical protein
VNAEFSNADQTAGALFTKHDYQNGCVTSKIDSTTSSSKELGTNICYYFKYLAVKHKLTKMLHQLGWKNKSLHHCNGWTQSDWYIIV